MKGTWITRIHTGVAVVLHACLIVAQKKTARPHGMKANLQWLIETSTCLPTAVISTNAILYLDIDSRCGMDGSLVLCICAAL
jgi:hypothetical protein